MIVRFPFLRGPLFDTSSTQHVAELLDRYCVRIWPGLPETWKAGKEGSRSRAPQGPWFVPEDLPYSPDEALRCVDDMQQLAATALSGLPASTLGMEWAQRTQQHDEVALRAALAQKGVEAAEEAVQEAEVMRERCSGQRTLIWCWLQEEHLSELAVLSEACTRTTLELHSDEAPVLPAEFIAPLSLDKNLLPPWRRVLAAALPFLPTYPFLLAEDDMRVALLDSLAKEWAPLPSGHILSQELPEPLFKALHYVRLPAWQILGRPRAPKCCASWLQEITVLVIPSVEELEKELEHVQ